jgi:hypothetical protein
MLLILLLTACGFSSVDNEMTGQVKKTMHNTPLICPDYTDADISLGVMRDGVGSMSTQDVWVVVPPELKLKVEHFAETGEIVNATYSVYRVTFCTSDHYLTSIEAAQ